MTPFGRLVRFASRLALPSLAGRHLTSPGPGRVAVVTGALLLLSGLALEAQQGATDDGEWPAHGGDNGMTRYSPLSQIAPENLSRLEVAWEWTSIDTPILEEHPQMGGTNFEVTPLKIGDVLYGTTGLSQAFALDAKSGETLWTYDPKAYNPEQRGGGLTFINRGMAYWKSGHEERLFFGTYEARLIALDPKSGQPIATFGKQGAVDTRQGIPRITNDRQFTFGSAPIVCGDVVILGNRIPDRPYRRSAPPGYIRGYDARTGKELWTFHSVPLAGEEGNDSWENDSWTYSGNTNVWTLLSADDALGYVYLPFGTPTNDFYGGERPGNNLFAESLVCLECKTGQLVWYFQAVHHGLWDYDLPAPPVLADIEVDGKKIPALAQLTKHGFAFVFNRETGEPVWPIEERPVPQSRVPGEKTSKTQPFPTKPPPFERQGITKDDLIDFTPELRRQALEILDKYEWGPLFMPPSEKGTILLPSYGGGANWPGAGLDPESGVLYVPSMTRPLLMTLAKPDPSRSDFAYVMAGNRLEGPQGLPLVKPPYGRVTAIDLNRGEILWTVTNGGDGPRDHAALKDLDLPPLGTPGRGAVLVTKTLLFVTEGSGRTGSAIGGGPGLRALDKKTGKELWRTEVSAEITGVPMTYLADGKQYVVAAVGSEPPKLVAWRLP